MAALIIKLCNDYQLSVSQLIILSSYDRLSQLYALWETVRSLVTHETQAPSSSSSTSD